MDVKSKPIIVNRRPKRRYRSKAQTTIKTIDDKRKHKRNESNVTVIRQPTAYITINKKSTAIRKASSSKQKRKRNSNHCYCRSPNHITNRTMKT